MRSSRERNAATTHPRRCRSSRTMGEFYLMTRKRLRRQVIEFVDVRGFDDPHGEIDPESRGDGGVSDKTGEEGRGQQLRDSRRDTRNPVPRPGPGQRKHSCAGVPEQVYSVGLLGAKTEIPVECLQ